MNVTKEYKVINHAWASHKEHLLVNWSVKHSSCQDCILTGNQQWYHIWQEMRIGLNNKPLSIPKKTHKQKESISLHQIKKLKETKLVLFFHFTLMYIFLSVNIFSVHMDKSTKLQDCIVASSMAINDKQADMIAPHKPCGLHTCTISLMNFKPPGPINEPARR